MSVRAFRAYSHHQSQQAEKRETSSRTENVLKYTLTECVDEFLMFKSDLLILHARSL